MLRAMVNIWRTLRRWVLLPGGGPIAAVVVTALAVLVRWIIDPWVGDLAHYALFYLAVALVATVAGWRAGLLATLLGAAVGFYLFVYGAGRFVADRSDNYAQMVLYVTVGCLMTCLAEWGRRQRGEAHRKAVELAQTVESLRLSEQRLQATFQSAGVGIAEADAEDRFTAVNDRLCRILGYSREELLGKTVHDLTAPEDRAQSDALNADLHAGRHNRIEYEKRYVKKDGRPIWVHVTVSCVRDERGRWVRAIAVIEDISARKAQESALAAAKISAERSKDMAEQANRAKDRFLAVLSHELRTPLTPVLATVSALQRQPDLDSAFRKDLEMIRRNAEVEARLIDDLLDVTRIARGKVELDRKPVELREVIRRAIEVVQPDVEARRLHLDADLDADAGYVVNADAARLQQVFWNLLRNAVKFTPEGGGLSVKVRAESAKDPALNAPDSALVEVSDTGQGIEPGDLDRIFNAFEQADRSAGRCLGGLGLGLTISKTLVEMHDGSISARSEGKGKGATFTVTLPVVSVIAGPLSISEARPAPLADHGERTAGERPLRILLVEDHGDTARILRRLLIAEGHEVETAGDVATALEAATQRPFDLLISDLGLPDASGLDLMHELRRRGHSLQGIALSGYGQEEDIRRSIEAGFAMHLTKPTSLERLVKAIGAVTSPAVHAAG